MATLADRNNNPGNIRDGTFAKSQPGYAGSNKGFAVFASVQDGFNAQVKLLRSYYDRGIDTVSKVINRYAPSSENNTGAYINDVSSALGINPNATLDPNNLGTLAATMARHEGFSGWKSLGGSAATNNPSSTPAKSGSVVDQVISAVTPTWVSELLNGQTAARWISVVIGIILIALAVAAFVLTSDAGKQVVSAVK